jgi:glucose-1-phosphate thymidylyltransferase
MKDIILAGRSGERLSSVTITFPKQLMPIYDKPMIHYPLSAYLHASMRDVLNLTTAGDAPLFKHLLGDAIFFG